MATNLVDTDTLTLDEVKEHLNIDFNVDDALLIGFIKTSAELVSAELHRPCLGTTITEIYAPTAIDRYTYLPTKPTNVEFKYSIKPTTSTVAFARKFQTGVNTDPQTSETLVAHNLNYSESQPYMDWTPANSGVYSVEDRNVVYDLYGALMEGMAIVDPAMTIEDVIHFQVIFSTTPRDGRLLTHIRLLLIAQMYENRSNSTYYRNMKWDMNATAILKTLRGASL